MVRASRWVPPPPGMIGEGDLRLAELGRLGGDDHVAEQGELAAAAQRPARDGGDHRRADRGEAAPEGLAGTELLVHVALGEGPDIGARGEGLVVARDDDAADVVVGVEAATASASSSRRPGESALRASGRFSRQSPTRPWVSR